MIIFEFMDFNNLGKKFFFSEDELKECLEIVPKNICEMLKRNGYGKMVLPNLQGLENLQHLVIDLIFLHKKSIKYYLKINL